MTESARKRLEDLKARQRRGEHGLCPRCGMDAMKRPVHTNMMSHEAELYICKTCGATEAMLAHMGQGDPLSCWAAFQPVRPAAGFADWPVGKALPEIVSGQMAELTRIYKLCRDDPDNGEWYRLEAFERCPGLTELWPRPFQANYRASGGMVVIRFKTGEDGCVQLAANIVGR